MPIDLAPPSRYEALPDRADDRPAPAMSRPPKILVFDSGLGGLTVHAEVAALRPWADYLYVADDAGFPYGRWTEDRLRPHVTAVIGRAVGSFAPDLVVVACNTASTLVLPDLRTAFPAIPFVGTVPAIKPAAASSRSRMISVLATPGTVARDYTRALIDSFAADCRVTLVGSTRLAGLAEQALGDAMPAAEPAIDAAVRAEIAPCFVAENGARTDCVVLACTHYPLLRPRLERLAPWPVAFIDPAPAIARRVDAVLLAQGFARGDGRHAIGRAVLTGGGPATAGQRRTFARFGLSVDEASIEMP